MATPPEPNRPSHDAVDANALAVPGGVRPVVWLADAAAPNALSPQLARALLDEHTRRGDVVVDIDDDIAVAAAAAETGRRHHALGGGHRLAAVGDAAGYVDLVLLRWPRPKVANPRWLLVACRTLLRHDTGVLVVAVRVPASQRLSHLSALTGAARAVGLRDVQHIAAFDPATTPGRRRHRAGATPAEADLDANPHPDTDHPGGHTLPDTAPHAAVVTPHTDLLIFTMEDAPHE
jgi:hypothetical protein